MEWAISGGCLMGHRHDGHNRGRTRVIQMRSHAIKDDVNVFISRAD